MELLNRNGLNYFSKGEGKYLYLIHGFPDCAHNFEDQIEFFSQRGFKVVAPYLPGYHENDKDLDSYQSLRVAEVLTDFIESISGNEKVYLFGHDWGAPIVYAIAKMRPDLLTKFSAASVPHGPSVQTAFLTDAAQQRKSWYMFFFQLPLADLSVPINNYQFIHELWKDWSPDFIDYKKYSDKVISVLSAPNVLAKALAYYRCTFQESLQLERINQKSLELATSKIQTPCLYFHGKNDGCIGYELSEGMEQSFDNLEIIILENCGHFLHLEKPDEFNNALLNFFTNS